MTKKHFDFEGGGLREFTVKTLRADKQKLEEYKQATLSELCKSADLMEFVAQMSIILEATGYSTVARETGLNRAGLTRLHRNSDVRASTLQTLINWCARSFGAQGAPSKTKKESVTSPRTAIKARRKVHA